VALVGKQVDAPISTASLPFGASVVIIGPGYPWYGAQHATYKDATHQPERLTAREGAAGQSSSELVEGTPSCFFAHRCPFSPKGGTRGLAPPSCTTKVSMRGYKAWRNFREYLFYEVG